MPNKHQSHSIFSLSNLLFLECSSNLKWSVAYGKAIQYVLVVTHLCQNLKEHESVGRTHIKRLIMSLSPMFKLWALVKTPDVCNLEQMHILSRLRTMCVVFTTPCRLDGSLSFYFSAVHYLESWQSLFSSLSKDGSPFPNSVSVNMELLARVWLAGAVRAFTTFCFLKYSFNKKLCDGRILRSTSVCGKLWSLLWLIGLGFIICWGVGDGYGAGICQIKLLISLPVHGSSILKPIGTTQEVLIFRALY